MATRRNTKAVSSALKSLQHAFGGGLPPTEAWPGRWEIPFRFNTISGRMAEPVANVECYGDVAALTDDDTYVLATQSGRLVAVK